MTDLPLFGVFAAAATDVAATEAAGTDFLVDRLVALADILYLVDRIMLVDIRDPSNLQFLLPILAASTAVDTAGIFIWKRSGPASSPINRWYSTLGLTAYSADILSLAIAVVLAQFITNWIGGKWQPWKFLASVVGVQMFHDITFAKIILPLLPKGYNKVVDLMKDYVNIPFSAGILLVDMSYVVLASLGAMFLAGQPMGWSVLILLLWLYIGMFALYDSPGSGR
ncbi:MAG: hypothetical protein EBT86_08000 [Actinobacteria bacterium]|nr:hypothetical protein [Actinomycetota bacterium]